MRRLFKFLLPVFIALILLCFISFLTDQNRYGGWVVQNNPGTRDEISWIKFYWGNETLGKKFYKKFAMIIPAKIAGIPKEFAFQFDLGSDKTMLYENTLTSCAIKYPELKYGIKKLKSPLQFWDQHQAFKNITIDFGSANATGKNCFVKKNYGEEISLDAIADNNSINIGTIGTDMFQNKILIIDYPNERFAVCDILPASYRTSFTNITLDKTGSAILPLQINGKTYKVKFDNGSSLFPLLVTDDKINNFSTEPGIDTISTSSWGTIHDVIGRQMKNNFVLGGKQFSNILIYADYRKEARLNEFDAVAGNALFWNNTIIIDYKYKKFGVK